MSTMITKLDVLGKEQYRKIVCPNCGDETDEDIENCFEAGFEF